MNESQSKYRLLPHRLPTVFAGMVKGWRLENSESEKTGYLSQWEVKWKKSGKGTLKSPGL